MTFRDLTAEDIECRIARVTEKGCQLLLYKNARCDMNILDETVGAENWQREHYECKGNLFCRVGIKDENGNWTFKSDCGSESNTEKEKGEASDSFKRACFNWGIGRELYTSPFIWIKAEDCVVEQTNQKDKYGKPIHKCKNTFNVDYVKVENKKIVALSISCKRKEVFKIGNVAYTEPLQKQNTEQDSNHVIALINLAKLKGVEVKILEKKYQVENIKCLTDKQYYDCTTGLQKMADKVGE